MIGGKTKTQQEADYRKIDKDSSSSLKEFSLDRRKYYKKYYMGEKVEDDDSKAATTGRVVETLLFEKDEFDNRFAMSSVKSAPTGNMLLFVEALYKHQKTCDTFAEAVKYAYKDSGYKWSLEKVLEKFDGSDAEIYYKEIKEVRDKGLTIVTADDIENAERVIDELKSNDFTCGVINLESNDRYEVHTQLKIEEYEIDGLPLKSMLDLVIIDHKNKTITPYDLKCVWSVEGFYEDYYLYRRAYIQAYLYKEACKQLKEDLELEYYRVENLSFIVCDSINYFAPLIYTLDSDDMQDAYKGFEYKGRTYPGVKDIISNLKWARENNIWNISKKNYENRGKCNIKG